MEEVLQRQPEPVRRFLLQTSILDRLCGSLCDAVTEHAGGRSGAAWKCWNGAISSLCRSTISASGLLPPPLRRCVARLIDEQADGVSELHRRASAWFEQTTRPWKPFSMRSWPKTSSVLRI